MAGRPLVYIDTTELQRLQRDLKKFDPVALTALRREIKKISAQAVRAVQDKVQEDLPGQGPAEGFDTRAGIAQGVSSKLSFAKKSAGVSIIASPKHLPALHSGFLAAYNKRSQLRHPVFGNREVWVNQTGNPYFGAVITPIANGEMMDALLLALKKAERAIGAR
jgi:hypothetical protein